MQWISLCVCLQATPQAFVASRDCHRKEISRGNNVNPVTDRMSAERLPPTNPISRHFGLAWYEIHRFDWGHIATFFSSIRTSVSNVLLTAAKLHICPNFVPALDCRSCLELSLYRSRLYYYHSCWKSKVSAVFGQAGSYTHTVCFLFNWDWKLEPWCFCLHARAMNHAIPTQQ